ncbi:MAG: MFS transporter, partial [Spirochaetaceae bacterium]|nr:MFS transporter [Spirochaetaceae bacterium]
ERKEYVSQKPPRLFASLKAAFRNRPFVFSMVMFLLTWMSIDLIQATLLYFVKHGVGRESQSDIIMAAIFVTALLALPVWLLVSNRADKRKAFIIGLSFLAVVQIILVTLTPATSLAVLLGICILAGVGVAAAHVLPWSIIPDTIEWDEWHTGSRHEGTFYSIVTLAQKVASSIVIPLALLMLGASGYVAAAETQPASAVLTIRLFVGPIPALLLVGAICFALFYPLDRSRHQKIVAELEARRAKENK